MVNLNYLYNPDAAKAYFEKNYFVDKKLGFQVIENGMILPHRPTNDEGKTKFLGFGGIVNINGEFIRGSFTYANNGGKYTPPTNQLYTARKRSFISEFLFTIGDIA